MAEYLDEYPIRYDVDYSENLSRLTTFFRLFTIIPIYIIFTVAVSHGALQALTVSSWTGLAGGAALLVLAPAMMILFEEKYPRWWFDWNLEFSRFGARVSAYFVLLTDEYPSTDDEQSVHLEIDYPNVREDLNRWLPLFKWLLAIPHYIILIILGLIAAVLIILSWFSILFTGSYPRPFFDFVVGVNRWGYRVQGYALLMVTDRYPPFSLS